MAHKRKRKEDIKKLISVVAYVYSFNWPAACNVNGCLWVWLRGKVKCRIDAENTSERCHRDRKFEWRRRQDEKKKTKRECKDEWRKRKTGQKKKANSGDGE